MYNLTVATAHTFFVGDGAWLVHNSCWPPDLSKESSIKRIVKQYPPTSFQCEKCANALAAEIEFLRGDVRSARAVKWYNPEFDYARIDTIDGRRVADNGYHYLVEIIGDDGTPFYLDSEIFTKK